MNHDLSMDEQQHNWLIKVALGNLTFLLHFNIT